jgi:hypothetical protein
LNDSLDVLALRVHHVLALDKLIVPLQNHLHEVRQLSSHNVLNQLVLGIQDNVSQLSEVLNNNLGVVTIHEEQLARKTYKDFVVVDEL